MNKFKLASPFFAGALLFTSIAVPASAQSQPATSFSQQTESLADMVASTTSNSVTFTDGSTLTQYDDHYISTSAEGEQFKIFKVEDNKVKYENLQTGEVNYAIKESLPIQQKQGLSANAEAAGDGFEYTGMLQNSTEILYATASLVAGVLASYIAGPTVGALVTVASYYVSMNGPRAYWVEKSYAKSVRHSEASATLTLKKDYHFYKYHDYTGFIQTVSTLQTCQPYGCGPISDAN